ncbi:MAG: methyltransferase domain-containing protein [Chloroflexi bacterium]|nr:methyltransferase domain-containing protein [Chloroflexota bacterium]
MSDQIKVNLACGKRNIPGFVHIDSDAYDHLDYQSDMGALPFFEDDAVDLIYCCHAFNYLDDDDASVALREWLRVLKPGGCLRLAVPDIEACMRAYLFSRDLTQIKRLTTGYYKGKGGVIWHRAIYDEATLSGVLRANGFTDVARYDWRSTEHAEYDDYSQAYLPHMDKENGLLVSLNMQGFKPRA